MTSFASIEGVEKLTNLGGVPALLLGLVVFGSLVKICLNPQKYDKTIGEKPVKNSKETIESLPKAL